MISITDLVKLVNTPAHCEEANSYRCGMLTYRDLFLKERENRMRNLEKLLPSLEWKSREDVRSTLRGLQEEYKEHHNGGIKI